MFTFYTHLEVRKKEDSPCVDFPQSRVLVNGIHVDIFSWDVRVVSRFKWEDGPLWKNGTWIEALRDSLEKPMAKSTAAICTRKHPNHGRRHIRWT